MAGSRVPRESRDVDARGRVAGALSAICLALAVPACLVGPSYARPKVPLNASWSEHRDPRIAAGAAVDIAWWRSLGDPALDRLIELAYRQNLPLQIAGLRILEARAALGIATGERYPRGGPVATASAVGVSDRAPNVANIDRHYREYQLGFDAIWEADLWGKFRRNIRAATAAHLATVADYDAVLVSLSAEVARTYVVIRTFEALIEQARQNAKVQEEGLQIADARFRNGATSELDVAQATTLLETTRASIPVLQIGLQQAHNALSTLLGRPTGYVQALLAEPGGIPTPPPRVAIGVPAELLRRRPDIRAAELRAIAQCERIGAAKAELYPRFTLFGIFGVQASGGTGAALGDLFSSGSVAYRAGGNLLWPLLDYPRIRNNVRVEDARLQQALVEYVDTVLRATREVEDELVGLLRQQDAAVFAQSAVVAAELAVNVSLIQYREGATDYQRVLDTQRVLLEAQNRLIETRSSAVTSLIALYKALGGGWELRAGAPAVPEHTRREMQQRTNWGKHLSTPPRRQPSPPRRK